MLKKRNVHFIGIGGIGMSAIAEILYSKGFTVSGSDITDNIIIRRLKKKGIKVFSKHAKQNIRNVDIVVYSSAVKFSNIEIKSAIKKKNSIVFKSNDACRCNETEIINYSIRVSW